MSNLRNPTRELVMKRNKYAAAHSKALDSLDLKRPKAVVNMQQRQAVP